MSASVEKVGAKKEAAILALLTARSIEEAARAADVPMRSLYRWLKEPEFDAAYRRAKRMAFRTGGIPAATGDQRRGRRDAEAYG